jgi:alpha-2-macroglobulin
VRVMLVAGLDSAYGSAEKSVFVRQPLMILPTLPRVVGPNEEVAVPVSVFAMDDSVRQVEVSIEGDSYFAVQGDGKTTLQFKAAGEQLALLKLKTASRIGQGLVKFTAVSGKHRATASINLSIRSPNAASIEFEQKTLQPGESFTSAINPHGLTGTNTAGLEVSSIPPLNLERRLAYLIQYPHGCLEQTTSALFPQLFLPALVKLDAARKSEVERNVNGGIARLQLFQQSHGGFSYWPGTESGYTGTSNFDPRASWSTNYVGHFLIEAERLGYHVPQAMRSGWLNYQRTAAQSWVPTTKLGSSHTLDQAYRLYTLALASQPDMGAMNRLREQTNLPITARWMLASAYKLAGMNEAAQALTQNYKIENGNQISEYPYPDDTFGSRLRDQAIVLTAMVSMGARDQAQPLVRAISENLSSQSWYSTQSLAYSLMAISKFVGVDQAGGESFIYNFEYDYAGKHKADRSDAPMYTTSLGAIPDGGAPLTFKNTSKRVLFVSVIARGISPPGESKASASGLSLDVEYADAKGKTVDVTKLTSGTDLIARITVRNNEPFEVKNIALTHMLPAGWEIMNDRMDSVDTKGDRNAEDERLKNDWYYAYYVKSRDKTEYLDIRDDRVQRYFSLQAGERVTFVTRLNAAYMGKFWLPGAQVEAMYDAARNARTAGQWVQVVGRGE